MYSTVFLHQLFGSAFGYAVKSLWITTSRFFHSIVCVSIHKPAANKVEFHIGQSPGIFQYPYQCHEIGINVDVGIVGWMAIVGGADHVQYARVYRCDVISAVDHTGISLLEIRAYVPLSAQQIYHALVISSM